MNGEPARQFVDTNVLVYAHDVSAGPKHDRAGNLVRELWNSGNGCISVQVVQEFYAAVTRKVPRPLAGEAAARIISDLGQWTVHVPTIQDVVAAIEIHQRHGISFWDALIIRSAGQLGCGVVWSEDLNPGQVYDGVCVRNPFAS